METTEIKKRQFIGLLAKRCKLKESKIKEVLDQLFLLVGDELKFNTEVSIPRICRLKTYFMPGKDRHLFDKGHNVFVDDHYVVRAYTKDELIDYVNGGKLDKKARAIEKEKEAQKDKRQKREVKKVVDVNSDERAIDDFVTRKLAELDSMREDFEV